jgi:hypothetical protein
MNGSGVLFWMLGLLLAGVSLRAGEGPAPFEQASQLYEQGKFTEAAAAYEQLLQSGHRTLPVYFNLGNAWFKAGQPGRSIAAYLHAERLAPRDPNVRFNLGFVRKKVTGTDAHPVPAWRRTLTALTVNEWATLTAGAWWMCFGLLAWQEVQPAWRRALQSYVVTLGVLTLLFGLGLVASSRLVASPLAVVIAREAVVRLGPLDESHIAFRLREGTEVGVTDEKRVGDQQWWLQIRDESGQSGWVKRDQVAVIAGPFGAGSSARPD